MNKKLLILNLVWILIAIGTFALGRYSLLTPNFSSSASSSKPALIGKTSDEKGKSSANTKAGDEDSTSSSIAFNEETLEFKTTRILSPDNMRQAILDALNEPNPLKSNLVFAQLLAQLTPENIEAAMDALRENADGPTMFRQMGLLTYAFGAMDGEKAIAYAQGLEGRGSVFTTSAALSGWAANNPQEAVTWLSSQEELDGMEKAMYARGLINGLSQTDLNAATQYALSVDDPDMQRQFFDVIAREQMNNGIESASAWVNTLPDDAKTDALYNIARQYTRDDIEAASQWAAKYATEPYGISAVAEVADEMAEKDPLAAIAWVDSLPEGDARTRGLASTFSEWGRSDPTAASEYLNSMPQSAEKDSAVGVFAATIAREDPESAITWASSVSDPEIREKSLVRAGQAYFRTDPAAAQSWVQTSGLSAESQEAVLNPPRPDRGGFGSSRGPGGRGRGPGDFFRR